MGSEEGGMEVDRGVVVDIVKAVGVERVLVALGWQQPRYRIL